MLRQTSEPSEILRNLIHGGVKSRQAVYVAAKLRLADHLDQRLRHSTTLATAIDVHPAALHRFLRGLVALGLLAEDGEGRFGLTPAGQLLRSETVGSLRGEAIVHAELDQAWYRLLHTVRSGETAFEHAFGSGIFLHFAHDADTSEYFHRWMAASIAEVIPEVIRAYPFPRKGTIVDVGGGHGSLLIAVLQQQPGLRGILADQAQILTGARQQVLDANLLERCEFEAHDFFVSVPKGGDLYILQRIIHDWNDDDAGRILQNCRSAMGQSAKLLLIEKIMPTQVSDCPGVALLDLNMLVEVGGVQRTEEQYRRLLASSGLCLHRVVATDSETSVLEAVPV